MEQKDYILREIEKIGMVLRAILKKLTGSSDNPAIQIEKQFEETKEMLASQMDFDLEDFIAQNEADSMHYLSQFKGINLENIESLAKVLMQMGLQSDSTHKKTYLEKALNLFIYCNQTDKTFSFEREENIALITNELRVLSKDQ